MTGKTASDAAKKSGLLQREQGFASAEDVGAAGREAEGLVRLAGQRAGGTIGRAGQEAGQLLDPFAQVGQQGLDLAGFLGDPGAQFDFLQNNPLFQSALDTANLRTEQRAASRGRLSSGDTLEQLSQNTLLAAQPLLQSQRSDILNLLNLGRGVATEQGDILRGTAGQRADIGLGTAGDLANLRTGTAADVANLQTGGTAAEAAGIVGGANVRGQAAGNILSGAITAAGLFSDERLKKNIKFIVNKNGHKTYSWEWNSLAKKLFNLIGSSRGVIAQEINKTNPEAITIESGFMKVNYEMIGVNHGS